MFALLGRADDFRLPSSVNKTKANSLRSLLSSRPSSAADQGLHLESLPAHSEVYILQRVSLGNDQFALYGQVQTGPHDGKRVWLPYDPYAPKSKLYTSDERDLLIYPTPIVEESYYAFTNEPIPVYRDDIWWTDVIEGLNHNDQQCLFTHRFEHVEKKLTATNFGTPIKATDMEDPSPAPPRARQRAPDTSASVPMKVQTCPHRQSATHRAA